MLFTQCILGFIPHSNARRMDCLESRPIGISHNLEWHSIEWYSRTSSWNAKR